MSNTIYGAIQLAWKEHIGFRAPKEIIAILVDLLPTYPDRGLLDLMQLTEKVKEYQNDSEYILASHTFLLTLPLYDYDMDSDDYEGHYGVIVKDNQFKFIKEGYRSRDFQFTEIFVEDHQFFDYDEFDPPTFNSPIVNEYDALHLKFYALYSSLIYEKLRKFLGDWEDYYAEQYDSDD